QVYTVRLKLAIMIETLIIIAKLVSKAAVATVQRRNAYTRLSSASSPSTPSQRVKVCRPTRVIARNIRGIRQETPSTSAREPRYPKTDTPATADRRDSPWGASTRHNPTSVLGQSGV